MSSLLKLVSHVLKCLGKGIQRWVKTQGAWESPDTGMRQLTVKQPPPQAIPTAGARMS